VDIRRRVEWSFSGRTIPTMSIYDNVASGLKLNGFVTRPFWTRQWRQPEGAALWEEVKDDLKKKSGGASRRPAAANVHRAGAGGRSRGVADG